MILAIGYTTERTFKHFVTNLKKKDTSHKILDLSKLTEVNEIRIVDFYNEQNLIVEIDNLSFNFSEFSSFYTRLFFTDLGNRELNISFSKMIMSIYSFLQLTNKLVVNKPSSGDSNINKFVHSVILKQYGFNTIRSVVSNSPSVMSGILNANSEWIVKGSSSMKTKVVAVEHYILSRLLKLQNSPSLFQPKIIGDNVRIHFVGNNYFAERIISERLDYRFSDDETNPNSYFPIEPPKDIITKCRNYCKAEELYFVGFDFIVNDNNWVILECNTMPGYESYDRRCKSKISEVLIELLTNPAVHLDSSSEQEKTMITREPFIPSFNRPKVSFL